MLSFILALCLFVEFSPDVSRFAVTEYFATRHITNLQYKIQKISANQIIVKDITFNHTTDGGIQTDYYIKQALLNYSLASLQNKRFTSIVINGLTINIILPQNFIQNARKGFHLVIIPSRALYANDVAIVLRRVGYEDHRISFLGELNIRRDNNRLYANMTGLVNYNAYEARLKVVGYHSLTDLEGEVQYQIIPPPLFQQRFKSLFFFPASVTSMTLLHGRLMGYGVFYWYVIKDNPDPNDIVYHLAGNTTITARDVIGSYGNIYFSGANGELAFNPLQPFSNDVIDKFTFKQVDLGILLTNVEMYYRLIDFGNEQHGMEISAIHGTFLNGDVSARAIKFKFRDPKRFFNVYLHQLALDLLVKLMGKEEWSASGHLDGVLPVTVTSAGVLIDKGNVYATDKGFIRYRSDKPSTDLINAGRGGKLLYELLDNFKYQKLTAIVEHDLYDNTNITMFLSGASQKLYDGIPVEFHIKTHGRIIRILQDINVSKSVGRQIQRLVDKE